MIIDPISFIAHKRDGKKHTPDEIKAFIDGALAGEIKDYQISAWLMAVCIRGLAYSETYALTRTLAESGRIYNWDKKTPPLVDKHSTGGVGDTVTLIVAPLVASMGMRMAKHSGRGLGHTGGTIDKFESIPNVRTELSEVEFKKIVNTAGCAIGSQDESMTPADGLLYAIRDVTATIESNSLIASSIISKKIAGGAQSVLLDIKVGQGAFIKDTSQARLLSNLMIRLGKSAGINVKSLITSMDEPLGNAIGNSLEVKDAISVLRNESAYDYPLRLISIDIAARLSAMCGLEKIQSARNTAAKRLASGDAADRFKEMIEMQGGNPEVVDRPDKYLLTSQTVLEIPSLSEGIVEICNARIIGELVRDLGGGRKSKTDKIDRDVGIILLVRSHERVEVGQTLCEVHTNDNLDREETIERARSAFKIVKRVSGERRLILN